MDDSESAKESQLSDLIGNRVAERRAALKLSLDDIAARTGVSRAMVSRIERGEVHASAVVLDRLCAGLGISLSELFARETTSPLLRRAEQTVWTDPSTGYIRRDIAPAGTGSPVKIVEIDFPPGAEVSFERSRHRVIDQHVWALKGEIEIESGGKHYKLSVGDCLHMRLVDRNTFRNTTSKPARYAVILTLESVA
ncbi:helix-turn-helix domain-containing protein [Roseiterribacter gracilis]|uniref:XRE family transcriptional regulator n=1 Tax=Roseiterribacter gracilis TaxID=2812848 RepID=A0A8S8X8D3_9PROT|nr:XRE family transcriptional regulator [Rhodospirillales bacterium TMPK1]